MRIIWGINISYEVIYIYIYRYIVGYKSTPNRWSQLKYVIFQMNYPAAELRGIIAMRSLQIISADRGKFVYRLFLGL